ncbi:hypothetical protein [Streptomyces sp. NPDC018045]|uniref:hypothetical protein n=1 Tax=Streptomyces sp. NPDC018045 TaxID=3365037 RepID=UPI00378780A6
MRISGKRGRLAGMATAAVFIGGMVLGTASAASAASPDYRCGNWKSNSHKWTASCSVRSGKARAATECYNAKRGTYGKHGRWVTRGNWAFGGDCGRDRLVSTGVDWKP